MREAQSLFLPKNGEYPTIEQYKDAQINLNKALQAMDEYRNTVRVSD